jgi:hypothetical protein
VASTRATGRMIVQLEEYTPPRAVGTKMEQPQAPPRLITIGYSHFCEIARWALQHRGVDFVEESCVQQGER